MIRRISKHNDLKDIIKSCPSGVIDDIYAIEYYIQGHNETIQASFTKTGEVLEVVLPTTDLETLPNGILMRRAFYKVLDSSYPDGYYNLQFEDNMNIWLGDVESEEAVIPDYVTEEELSSTLSSYATQSWVYGRGYATESYVSGQIGSVKNWVVSQSFLTSASLSNYITESTIESLGFATESWVQGQGYLTSHQDLSSYATQSWVQSQGYITIGEIPSGLATQSWVQQQGYLTSVPSEYATQSWVSSQQFATQSWVSSRNYITEGDMNRYLSNYSYLSEGNIDEYLGEQGYYVVNEGEAVLTDANMSYYSIATENWVQSQGYITIGDIPSGLATQSWVQSQGYLTSVPSEYATQSWVTDNFPTKSEAVDLVNDGITYTKLWVQSQGYLTYSSISNYATQSWVSSQQFATQSWVQGQGYYTSSSTIPASIIGDNLESRVYDIEIGATEIPGYVTNEDIGSYATKAWVSSNFFEESKIWTGTQAQWNALTASQKAGYTIALITQ